MDADWSRRRFLSARGLGASAGGILGARVTEARPRSDADDVRMAHWCVSRRAMACEFTVYLRPTERVPMAAGEAALDVIDDMEELLSVYREGSGVSYLNRNADQGPVRVDGRLFELLRRSGELWRETGGAFDVSAGALVRVWGFIGGPRRVPEDAEREAALAATGMQHVELDEADLSVRYLVPGLEVNFGSIGKGYAIDRALERVREDYGIDCAMIQGGLSSIRAVGSPAADGRGWLVGIRNPYDARARVATVRLRDRALGTSGAANQYFESAGRRYGHVLDPRTGWPAEGLASASVLARDGATADALATGLFVMGLDKAREFCHNHPDVAALCVLNADQGGPAERRPRVVTFNLPPEDVDLDLRP